MTFSAVEFIKIDNVEEFLKIGFLATPTFSVIFTRDAKWEQLLLQHQNFWEKKCFTSSIRY